MKKRKSVTEVVRTAESKWKLSEGGRAAVRALYPLGDGFDSSVERIDENKEGLRTEKGMEIDRKAARTTLVKDVNVNSDWRVRHFDGYQRRLDLIWADIAKEQKRGDTRDPVTRALDELKSELRLQSFVRQMDGLDSLGRDILFRGLPDAFKASLPEVLPPMIVRTKDGFSVEPLVSPAVVEEAHAARLQAQIPEETRRLIAELEEEKHTLETAVSLILAEAERIAPSDPNDDPITVR